MAGARKSARSLTGIIAVHILRNWAKVTVIQLECMAGARKGAESFGWQYGPLSD